MTSTPPSHARLRRRAPSTERTLNVPTLLPLWQRIHQEFILHSQRWGLPPKVYMALVYLYTNPGEAEPAMIAQAIFAPRQTVTSVLNTLERQQLATREAHPHDLRRMQIRLTAKGQRLAHDILQNLIEFETAALQVLAQHKVPALLKDLNRYADALVAQNDRAAQT
ncbi:MAG: winged helix-turn-helix transcriptional regulator [Lentisphaerae bacterium]|nr:winged helix-turn-helix transcriptional regulator [Lentisphaerota bacterium]